MRPRTDFVPEGTSGRRPTPALRTLRTDIPLEPGYVLTIEPGLYFVPPLLTNPENRTKYADCVAWDKVDKLHDAGGVRIEDNILITKDGPENLTREIAK